MDEDLYSFADKAVLTGPNGPKDNKKADTERYLSDNIQAKPVKSRVRQFLHKTAVCITRIYDSRRKINENFLPESYKSLQFSLPLSREVSRCIRSGILRPAGARLRESQPVCMLL